MEQPRKEDYLKAKKITTHSSNDDKSGWVKGEPKTALVIGGLGFLGYHLSSQLLNDGDDVTILEDIGSSVDDQMKRMRLDEINRNLHYKVHMIRGTACDSNILKKLFNERIFTHVIYVPPDANRDILESTEYAHRTIGCATVLMETMKDASLNSLVNCRLVLVTTTELKVYKPSDKTPSPLPEQTVILQGDTNAGILLSLEHFASVYNHLYKIPYTVLRVSNIYGPFMDYSSIIYRLVETVLHPLQRSNGDTNSTDVLLDLVDRDPIALQEKHDYLGVKDAVNSIVSAIEQGNLCRVIEIKSGEKTTLEHIYSIIQNVRGSLSSPRHLKHLSNRYTREKDVVKKRETNSVDARIREKYQSSQKSSLQIGIQEYIAWYETFRDRVVPSGKSDYIFSCYYTSNFDPQRNVHIRKDRFEYMKNWLWSVQDLGLQAVIFHDGLGTDFIEAIENDNITFVYSPLKRRTTNDARFFAYLDYLDEHKSIQRVFLTDISDVKFLRNPFELMDLLGDILYVGLDNDIFPNMESMDWLYKRVIECFGVESAEKGDLASVKNLNRVYNAGVIGASRYMMLQLLEQVTQALNGTPRDVNCNMPTVNYVFHKYFDDRIFTGFPLSSKFMRRRETGIGVYVLHK
ncbi:uncharacterized protein LOC144440616 [Glandiceps talaboti]